MPAPAAIKATFADFRLVKTRKLAQFVFELPIEAADEALRVLGGLPCSDSERWCGIALLTDPEDDAALVQEGKALYKKLVAEQRSAQSKQQYQAKSDAEQAVTRAAMLVKDKEYWAWVSCHSEDDADKFMKWACLIRSKADISSDPEAYRRFIEHELQYRRSREKPAA